MREFSVVRIIRRHWVAIGFGLLLLAALPPLVAVAASAPLRDFLYREISYMALTDRLVGDERDPEKMALTLNDFVAQNVYPGGGYVLDTNSWNDLVRGIGWCDQDAWMLGTFLATRDVEARLLFLEGPEGRPQHTVAEVYANDDWRIFDPLYGLVFPGEKSLATLDDLARDPGVAARHPAVKALPQASRAEVQDTFQRLYSNTKDSGNWSTLRNSKYGSRARLAVRQAIRAYLTVFGGWGARRFQDVYLGLLPDRLVAYDTAIRDANRPVFKTEKEDPALFLYYRARNYHLYERTNEAERLYREILTRYPQSDYGEKSAYFLALLEWKLRGQPKPALDRLSAFVTTYPNSGWVRLAHDTMGAISEQLGDVHGAVEHYRLASSDPYLKSAYRLVQLHAGEEGAATP